MGKGQDSEQRRWSVEYKTGAQRQLHGIAKRNPKLAENIVRKIRWLAENADSIDHEKLVGRTEFSLHVGQYRILYELDRKQRRIIIARIAPHNAAYRR
jgi:mRNA-degrading endonuclease RelE of RelBE toxin-antitoxin system